jgi:hypothetical protein
MERYLEWKNLITKETRSELSEESKKDYYDIRNCLAIKALAEQSSK